MKKLFLFSLAIFLFTQVNSQNWNELQKIVASDRGLLDEFGYSVCISGKYALVGAWKEDENATGGNTLSGAGSAYIFERNVSGAWIQVQKIVASDREVDATFGYSVSIDGNYAIVGANSEDKDATGGNTKSNAGAAYIFERNTSGVWIQVQKIVAVDRQANDAFGWSVCISGDYIIVGSPNEDHNGTGNYNYGSAYIFKRNSYGVWTQVQKLVASDPGTHDFFAESVSISGNYAVIGAHLEDHNVTGGSYMNYAGSAYVFERNTSGSWNQAQKIVASDRTLKDNFGCSVSISGNYIIVGANDEDHNVTGGNYISKSGSAYIFERNISGNWIQAQKIVASDRALDDEFGIAVSISGDYAIVGAWKEDENATGGSTMYYAGSAYIFARGTSGNWSQTQKTVASDRAINDYFGSSVSISGNNTIVGAKWENEDAFGGNSIAAAGSAYLYKTCINLNSSSIDTITACNNYLSPSGNYNWTNSGNYVDTIANLFGCDSVITINLTINKTSDTINPIVCNSYLSPSGNYTWTTSGTYIDTIPITGGCDSIIIVNLTINSTYASISPIVCDSFVSPSGNYIWTSDGIYFDTIPNSKGCDSIITVNLSINNSTNSITPNACGSYTSPSGNYTWSTSGTYNDTITNAASCDSIITINLTINNSTSATINLTSCDSYTSPSGNYIWTTSGTYQDTILNAKGCDSIITVNLIISNSTSATTNPTVCDHYSSPSGYYIWTSSGTYMDTIPNASGCDSIITINLTINNSTNSNINQFACYSYTSPSGNYIWNSSGTYTDTILNSSGCDSIITINLTVNTVDTSVTQTGINLSANVSGAAYQWLDCNNGYSIIAGATNQSFTPSANGSYAVEVTENGCIDTSACYLVTGVGIIENDFGSSFNFYPNPTSGKVSVDLGKTYKEIELKATNILGQLVLSKSFKTTNKLSFEIKESTGVYFVEIRTNEGKSAVFKVLKE